MDALGWRAKIGVVMPSTNTTVQPECDDMRPRGVTNHVGRVHIEERKLDSDQAFIDHVAAMRGGIADAIARVKTCDPAHLVMGVALEAFWGGVEASLELTRELEEQAGVKVSIGSTAARLALEAFGAKTIAVLTPHMPRGDDMVRRYLEEAGFAVVRLKGLKCASPRLIAHVQPAEIRAALLELDGDDVDALLQVGTNLAGMATCAEAERWLAKPVLSMNPVTYWHALRTLGIEDRIEGFGRILEDY